MLREALAYLLTPASRQARRLGHAYEGIAIEARHRRCRAAWEPHLRHCHGAIIAAAESCEARGLVVVLGSGALLDIPLEHLAGVFQQVALVDVFHPPMARRKARGLANVTMLTHDLLGLAEGWEGAAHRLGDWRKLLPPPDLVISANLLAQLPLKPLDHWPEAQAGAEDWAAAVMAAHLRDLRDGPGKALVLSEWRRRWSDRAGELIHEEHPLAGLAMQPPVQGWRWELAPAGELPDGETLAADVGAYRLA